jgi:hypothetical protein
MSFFKYSGRLGWLTSILGDKKARIGHLLGEIASLGPPGLMKPGIFRKFLALLAQVATEEEKEIDFINHIEAVELEHRFRRDHNQLERANPDYAPELDCDNKKTSRRKGLLSFFKLQKKPEDA